MRTSPRLRILADGVAAELGYVPVEALGNAAAGANLVIANATIALGAGSLALQTDLVIQDADIAIVTGPIVLVPDAGEEEEARRGSGGQHVLWVPNWPRRQRAPAVKHDDDLARRLDRVAKMRMSNLDRHHTR